MVRIGNFFFRYRNFLFIFLYLALLIPSPLLFSLTYFGPNYYWLPLILGLAITILGQLIRGVTISLAYIVRGGKDKKVYADGLITKGMFAHCRNPLYVGNILMLFGLAILMNSLFYVVIVIPVFLFIYQAMVLAEENYLQQKFGKSFDSYCKKVSRWGIRLNGLGETIRSMQFNGKRWLIKEYNTQAIWLTGIFSILFFRYPLLAQNRPHFRNALFFIFLLLIVVFYCSVRYRKKKGIWKA